MWFRHVSLASPKPCSLIFLTVHGVCLNLVCLRQIKTTLSDICRKEGVEDNTQAVFNFLINRVRANVHVVLCMSPVGEDFRFVYMSALDAFYRVGGVQINVTNLACGCPCSQGWLTLCFDVFVIVSVVSTPDPFTHLPSPPPPHTPPSTPPRPCNPLLQT